MEERRNSPQEFHCGDILLDHYASENNPLRKSIINGSNGRYVFVLYPHKRRLHKAAFSKYDVQYDKKFEIVGRVNLEKLISDAIQIPQAALDISQRGNGSEDSVQNS